MKLVGRRRPAVGHCRKCQEPTRQRQRALLGNAHELASSILVSLTAIGEEEYVSVTRKRSNAFRMCCARILGASMATREITVLRKARIRSSINALPAFQCCRSAQSNRRAGSCARRKRRAIMCSALHGISQMGYAHIQGLAI